MDEEFVKQVMAEIIHSTGEAFGLLAATIARRGNATQLAEDLRGTIGAAKLTQGCSPMAIRIATAALAAVEAESAHQNPAKH